MRTWLRACLLVSLLSVCQRVAYSHGESYSRHQEVMFCQHCGGELFFGIQHYCPQNKGYYKQRDMIFGSPWGRPNGYDYCPPSYHNCEPGIYRWGTMDHYHLLKKKKKR